MSERTEGFSEEERAAMQSRAEELRNEGGRGSAKAARDTADVLAKIAQMIDHDRAIAERIHAIIAEHAPHWRPKLWYGQPAYASDGKVMCFFRSGHVDHERYSTFGFSTEAPLDDESGLWPTSYAVAELTPEAVRTISRLVRRAAES